jgi:hypothetical protein
MVPGNSRGVKSAKGTTGPAPRQKSAIAFRLICNVVLTLGVSDGLGDAMDDKDSIVKKVEDRIKDAAKAVEDFADEVAAPEEPVVIVPDKDTPPGSPPAGKKDG